MSKSSPPVRSLGPKEPRRRFRQGIIDGFAKGAVASRPRVCLLFIILFPLDGHKWSFTFLCGECVKLSDL